MIAYRQVSPVWLESVLRISEHTTDVVSMILGRIKVSVVSDEDWHAHLNLVILNAEQGFFFELLFQLRGSFSEDLLERLP